ncbi:hypothetical protein PGTUg99_002024 [Puccinia graminis f. sp. tritici]|uniref:Uncharacterized protein n=1 Tax=Puccinia graminis f. sp. tritici TaxID=56615 RepID=A0A5B0PVX5_PUCGR|nr:hypothetical protein PGTUg99_002024 [Puccinia graminis f. sp. tritici]
MPDDKSWLTMRIDTAALLGLKQPHSSKLKSRMTVRMLAHSIAYASPSSFLTSSHFLPCHCQGQSHSLRSSTATACFKARIHETSAGDLILVKLVLWLGPASQNDFQEKTTSGVPAFELPLVREPAYRLRGQLQLEFPARTDSCCLRIKRRKILDGHHLYPKLHSAANLSTAHVVNRVFYLILSKKLV